MPQRFESTQTQDALDHAISWPTLEDGSDVEFPSDELWPEQAMIVLETAQEEFVLG